RLAHLAQGAGVAREAAQTAAQGLGTVAAEAEANDVWSREIANMAGEMRRLVEEIGARLNSVAEGTENLLASAQEIAASRVEPSATTAVPPPWLLHPPPSQRDADRPRPAASPPANPMPAPTSAPVPLAPPRT